MHDESDDPLSRSEQAVIELAIDVVRFVRTYQGLLATLEPDEARRYAARASFLTGRVQNHLASIGLSLGTTTEGHPYDPGLPVRVLNLEDFGPDDSLMIAQVLEPVILGPNGIRREGVVLVEKVTNQ